jgi:hypothetical protein
MLRFSIASFRRGMVHGFVRNRFPPPVVGYEAHDHIIQGGMPNGLIV